MFDLFLQAPAKFIRVLSLDAYRFSPLGALALLSFFVVLLAGLLIFRRQGKTPIGAVFFALAIFSSLWILGYALDLFSAGPGTAETWSRFSFSAFCFMPPTMFLFTTTFLGSRRRFLPVFILGILISYAMVITTIWTDWLVRGVLEYPWGYGIVFGKGRAFFFTFFLTFILASIVHLLDAHEKERSLFTRKQIRILLIAFLVGIAGSTDLYLSEGLPLYPWSYLSTAGFILILFYEMNRYPNLLSVPSSAYDRIFQTMSDSLFILDPLGRITSVNPALCRLLGREEEELMGRSVDRLFPFPDHPFHPDILAAERKTGQTPETVNTWLLAASGNQVPVSLARTLVLQPSGRLIAHAGIARDMRHMYRMKSDLEVLNEELKNKIEEAREKSRKLESSYRELQASRDTIVQVMNEREATYNELVDANERLKMLDKMKDQFLASVSHEFRSPLTSIRSFTELLLNYPEEPVATRLEFLQIVHNESQRLTRLINNCLDLSKIKAGKMTWKEVPVDVEALAREVIDSFRPQALGREIELTLESRGDLPPVRIDKDRLTQVFHNLLSNAFSFVETGGEIRVELERLAADNPGEPGETVRITVSDTGRGIPEHELQKIFERFRQGGDAFTGKPAGTGLGLTICQEIVNHYDGKIWAESEPGKGSRFFVTLKG